MNQKNKKFTKKKILAVKFKKKICRFSRSLRFKPISAKAIEEIVDNFCSLS